MTACPLCGLPAHAGRCSRLSKGEWWCGLCLTETLTPADLEGPALSAATLLSVGIQRTSRWCSWCGTPICLAHRDHVDRPHCKKPEGALGDCRSRGPRWVETLKQTLKKYVPDYLTAGPQRCSVCGLPALKKGLCSRHYASVRRGNVHVFVERQRRAPSGTRMKCISVYLLPEVAALAEELACEDGQVLAKWIGDRIKMEIMRRRNVNLLHPHVVIPIA